MCWVDLIIAVWLVSTVVVLIELWNVRPLDWEEPREYDE